MRTDCNLCKQAEQERAAQAEADRKAAVKAELLDEVAVRNMVTELSKTIDYNKIKIVYLNWTGRQVEDMW